MAANVSLVVNAAERDARELASERSRDRLAERGLADAGRSDQRDDRAGSAPAEHRETALLAQLAHGEELDDAVLHVVEAGVVLVEDATRVGEVVVVLGAHVPRDVEHPVQVRADPAVLGVLLAGALQPAELALHLGADLLGHARLRRSARGSRRRRRRRPRRAPCVIASSCWRSRNSRCVFSIPSLTSLRIFSFSDASARIARVQSMSRRSRASTSSVSRTSHLLIDAEVGRVAGQVGQLPGGPRRAEELHDAGCAPALDQVLEHRAVLAGELPAPARWARAR